MYAKLNIGTSPYNERTLKFPFNQIKSRFDADFYSPALTDGRVSIEEIDQILSQIEAKKRKYALKRRRVTICWLIFTFVSCSLFASGVVFLVPGEAALLPVFIVLFMIACLVMLGCVCAIFNYPSTMRRKCQNIVERQNFKLGSSGVRWHLPKEFPAWIELCKDYYQPENYTEEENQEVVEEEQQTRKQSEKQEQLEQTYSPPSRQFYTPFNNDQQT